MPRKPRQPCVYIMSNRPCGTLYIGVTSDLPARVWQHKQKLVAGFTRRYGLDILVWYEQHATMESAILRERRLKKWLRAWKLDLVAGTNPTWRDLAAEL